MSACSIKTILHSETLQPWIIFQFLLFLLLASSSRYRCSYCSHFSFREKMAIKTTISKSARSRMPGLKSEPLLCMAALLYQPEKKLSTMGITKRRPNGMPNKNCRKTLFCLSRFAFPIFHKGFFLFAKHQVAV